MLTIRLPSFMQLTQSKRLYNYYKIAAVNLCLHFASLEQYNTILSSNSIPPSLLTTLPSVPNCCLITFPPLRPCHLTILPPFPFFHLTPLAQCSHRYHPTLLTHLSHPPNSPLHSANFPRSPPSQRLVDTSDIITFFYQVDRANTCD